jgi:hypothetical protein
LTAAGAHGETGDITDPGPVTYLPGRNTLWKEEFKKKGDPAMFLNEAINQAFGATKRHTYLEIGVAAGRTFLVIDAGLKIGVDPIAPSSEVAAALGPDIRYYQATSDDFFAEQAGILDAPGLDFAFIDGLHTYAQSLQDVENCLRYLNRSGLIVMHDCNPTTVGLTQSGCSGDVWKTIVHLRSTRRDLGVFVLNFDYGLGFVYYGASENGLDFTPEAIAQMTFADLDPQRESLLNLKPAGYFGSFLSAFANGKSD